MSHIVKYLAYSSTITCLKIITVTNDGIGPTILSKINITVIVSLA